LLILKPLMNGAIRQDAGLNIADFKIHRAASTALILV
jgi:hypothetical protein